MIVLDTNVLSEALRRSPSGVVMRWLAAQEPMAIFVTAVTQAEILYGVESMPPGKRRTLLREAIGRMFAADFRDRILAFEEESAREFAKIVTAREAMGRPISQFHAMIAAISRSRRAAIATRNIQDFEHCGLRVLNPWVE